MSRRRAALTLSALTTATIAWLGLVAEPAAACSCPRPGSIAEELAAGRTLAIMTRVDDGIDHERNTFRVDHSEGPPVPATMTVSGNGCDTQAGPGEVVAAFVDLTTGWDPFSSCSQIELGPAFARLLGEPRPSSGGPPVAVAVGSFGGSRLAALDRDGAVVAWDGNSGFGEAVALCPGGRTVVAIGWTGAEDYDWGTLELTRHQLPSLRTLSRVPLEGIGATSLECGDPDGRTIRLLKWGGRAGTVVTVDGETMTSRRLDTVPASGGPGLVPASSPGDPISIRVHPPDGRSRVVHLFGQESRSFPVSPDGRTIAVEYSHRNDQMGLATFDVATGQQLGTWTEEHLWMTALAWTDDNRLLVRKDAPAPRDAFTPRVFDRHLRELRPWASVPGAPFPMRFDTVGNSAVSYGTRLTIAGQTGPARVLEEIRLAGAGDVVALQGGSFATDAAVIGALTPRTSTDDPAWPVLAGVLLLGIGVMGSGRALR